MIISSLDMTYGHLIFNIFEAFKHESVNSSIIHFVNYTFIYQLFNLVLRFSIQLCDLQPTNPYLSVVAFCFDCYRIISSIFNFSFAMLYVK